MRLIHKILDHTKITAKQGNAEERPDAGCEIKRWNSASEMSQFFINSIGYLRADKRNYQTFHASPTTPNKSSIINIKEQIRRTKSILRFH